jgi:hypothetical protein
MIVRRLLDHPTIVGMSKAYNASHTGLNTDEGGT